MLGAGCSDNGMTGLAFAAGIGGNFSGVTCTVVLGAGADCATVDSSVSFNAQLIVGVSNNIKQPLDISRFVIIFNMVSMLHISIILF